MPTRLSLCLIAIASLCWGCDTDGGQSSTPCSDLQLSTGTFSATLSQGEMRPNCFSVSEAAGRTLLIAYEVGDALAGDIRTPLTLTIDGSGPGTYVLDDNGDENDTDESFAQVGATNSLEPSFATSGSVSVEILSSTRMSGTFSFTTSTGLVVSNGRFSVDR